MTNYHLQLFPRLEPRTQQFNSGKDIPSTRVLTLDEAAKFASKHADTEVTPGDFLHAAAEGKIMLRAIVHRTAKLQAHDGGIYCNRGTPDENTIPEWAIANLPVCACQGLAVVGCAKWRTLDGFKLEGGELLRFTAATLVDGEPDFETVLTDCRVTADAVHALADAFIDYHATREAESKDAGETLADNSRVFTKRAMVAELKGIWPSITGDISEASREKGELKAANVRRGYWNVDMCIKWAVAHMKITNNQQLKNYVIEKDDSPFAALLKTLFKI